MFKRVFRDLNVCNVKRYCSNTREVSNMSQYRIKNLSNYEKIVACCVFAVAGTSAAMIVKPTLGLIVNNEAIGRNILNFNEETGLINGPMHYRMLYVMLMTPTYSLCLYTTSVIFNRRNFFAFVIWRMWNRFLPSSKSKLLQEKLNLKL